ncbi:hypothetical protein NE619_18155, partial [Anaerovorax odorimutans]
PMEVKVANRTYRMGKKEYQGLLKVASEQVPFGIYAVEKNGYAELMNIKCDSITQLKQRIRDFKSQGWKVYQNGR